jgi:sugar O-acyltransferase (sialic acid O-acetyltransferase NeuD family)
MLLYGGGGHAKVVIDCLSEMKVGMLGIFDNQALSGRFEQVYLGKYSKEILPENELIISIGDNKIRRTITNNISHQFGIAKHPSAIVSEFSKIGEGSMVFHLSIIQSDSVIGKHCIVNTSSIIEHDCIVGDFAHVATNATLCGGVHVGEGTLIGAGATVLSKVKIGKWCIIGAGSLVNRDVPDFSVIAGIPAKLIRMTDGK